MKNKTNNEPNAPGKRILALGRRALHAEERERDARDRDGRAPAPKPLKHERQRQQVPHQKRAEVRDVHDGQPRRADAFLHAALMRGR